MSQGTESADSLARAIGEFRTELLVWIDTELARLQERDQGESPVVGERSTAPRSMGAGLRGGSQPGSLTDVDAARPGSPDLRSGMGRETLREGQSFLDRNGNTELTGPTVAVPGPETDPPPEANPGNPRERLEALARLLDQRLKQVEGASGTRLDAASGRTQGIPDESLGPSGGPAVPWTARGD
jgi:hypothetical protein